MKKTDLILMAFVFGVAFCLPPISGCGKEGAATVSNDPKAARFLAIENENLKKQLADQKLQSEEQINSLKKQHADEMAGRQTQLDNCMAENKNLQEMSQKGVDGYMQNVLSPVVDENAKLKKEIESLKAQIEELKKK
jgi:regulator of replication initiation timing